jgi:hypothetical protein
MEREDELLPSNLLYRIEGYVGVDKQCDMWYIKKERNRSRWVGKEINMVGGGGRDEAETMTRAVEQELQC